MGVTRRALFVFLADVPKRAAPQKAQDAPCGVNLVVDPGPSMRITIPNVSKESLIEIASTFFAQHAPDRAASMKKLSEAFQKAKDLSVTLTTRCDKSP